MDYRQRPSSTALYPHMGESKDARRTGLKGDFWIPRIDACELERLLSGNDYRVTKVAYHDVAPVKCGKSGKRRNVLRCSETEEITI